VFPKANARVRDEILAYCDLIINAGQVVKAKKKELSPQAIQDIKQLFQVE